MSSEDIPRIPQRPQRVHRPHDVNEPSQTRSLSSPSVDEPSLSDSDPESPQVPVNRPQRLKTKSPTPVEETAMDCGVELPSIPSARPNRATADETSTKNAPRYDESSRPPVSHPQRVRTTSPIPSAAIAGPLPKANTVDAIGGLGAPSMPLNRPVRRTTTESLDRLVQNTSVQLKEMEQLLSKHNERAKEPGNPEAQRVSSSKEGLLPEADKDEFESIKEASEEQQLNRQEDEPEERQRDHQYAQAVSKNGIISSEADSLHESEPSEEVGEKQESWGPPEVDPLSNEDDKIVISANEREHVNEELKEQSETPSDAVESSPDGTPKMPRRPNKTGRSKLPANDCPKSETQTPEPELKPDDSSGSETSTKKRAPPVPKKPSSRIAAFQEMLQKKQLEQLQGPKPQHTLKQEVAESQQSKSGEGKAQFRQNLNALFTVPGAAGPAGVGTTSSETPTSESSSEDKKEKPLRDVRQKRARGPRGRKLPSKVATIEKVRYESTGNDIEVFHSWTTFPCTRKEDKEDRIVKEEAIQLPSAEQDSLANDGIEERRSSVVQLPSGQKAETLAPLINHPESSLNELVEELEPEHSGSIPGTDEKELEVGEVGPEVFESPQEKSLSKQISKDDVSPELRTSKNISEDRITDNVEITEK